MATHPTKSLSEVNPSSGDDTGQQRDQPISLTNELNEPLTAILSNAQAAQRILAQDEPDLDEIGAILSDIVADDKRANEIIHRLRNLLK